MRALLAFVFFLLAGAANAQLVLPGAGGSGGTGCTVSGTQFQILAVNSAGTGCTPDSNATVNAGALVLGASGTPGSVTMGNATTGLISLQPVTGALGTVTLSLPAATDTLTGKATTDILTNKTLTSSTDVLGGVTLTLGSDATGDMYYRSAGGVLTRLAVCTGTNVLGASGGLPACVAQSGGGAPGGANTNVQFNNSSAFGGDAGFNYLGTGQVTIVNSTATTTALAISGGSVTGSSTVTPGITVAATINTSGIVKGEGLYVNITDTARGIGSTGIEYDVGGASKFNVDATGFIRLAAATYGAGNAYYQAAAGIGSAGNLLFAAGNTFAAELQSNGLFNLPSTGTYSWFSGTSFGGSVDTSLTRGAAATIQMGAANAASPVSQTLQAQGSRPGTDTNVGGGNITVTSGNGTGTGTLSSLVLQSPVAVASGTGAQTQTTGLTIKGGTAVLSGYTVATLPASPTTGAMAYVTDAIACTFLATVTGGGSAFCPVIWTGAAWQGS